MDLRKTSTIFRDGARKKMEEAMMHLKSKGVEEWSSEDKELHAYVKSNQQIFM